MCSLAEHGPDAVNDGAVSCTVNGKPVVGLRVCPRGYFDEGMHITWCGVRWIGLPWPMRVFLWTVKRTHPPIKSWSGCGCLAWLKWLLTRNAHRGVPAAKA